MTAQKIIDTARKYVGKSGDEFWRAYGLSSRVAWCAIFQWFVFREAGASALFYDGKKTAYVPTLWAAAKYAGKTSDTPRAGDLVCYDWNANNAPDHVGLVVSASATSIHTIEGNVDDKVKELNRTRNNQILGYIRPDYTEETAGNCENCPVLEALRTLYNKVKEESEK